MSTSSKYRCDRDGTHSHRLTHWLLLTVCFAVIMMPAELLAQTTKYAATSLTVAASSGQSLSTFTDANCDTGSCVFYDSTTAGNFVSFAVNVPAAGTYDIQVAAKTINTRGIFQLAVASGADGAYTNVGPAEDEYSAAAGYPAFDLGNFTFNSAGTWVFRFTVTGQNGASSGFTLSFSYIGLTPTAVSTVYAATSLTVAASSGQSVSTFPDANCDGGSCVFYNSNAAGDFVSFAVNVPTAGTYDIKVAYKALTSRGIFQAAIASSVSGTYSNLGPAVDEYASLASYPASDLGNFTFSSAGTWIFRFTVTGKNSASSGSTLSFSSIALTPTTAPPPPNPPANLGATAVSSSQINLSWTASTTTGVTYSIFRSTTSGFIPSSSNQVASGVSSTAYSDTGVAASTTYYYLAEAVNPAGSSSPSNQASATTQAGVTTFNLPPGVLILVDSSEAGPIQVAILDLQRDLKNVLGVSSTVVNDPTAIAGQPAIVVTCRGAATASYRDSTLTGVESHELMAEGTSSAPRMVLQGADTRGTIYAIYEFSNDYLNIPPLWFWASWQPQTMAQVSFSSSLKMRFDSPNVRWRAWFPNDRDLLAPWMNQSTTNYNSIFETLLRLKYNTLDIGYMADFSGASSLSQLGLQLAQTCKSRGIAVTFTHLAPFGASFGDWNAYWNNVAHQTPPALAFSSSGTLTSTMQSELQQFWGYYIKLAQNQGFEVVENLAFRGTNDRGFWTLFSNSPTTDQARAAIVNQILGIQLALLKNTWNTNLTPLPPARTMFYNEVQTYMAEGFLNPPVDPDLIWNFSNQQRDHFPYTDIMTYDSAAFTNNPVGYYLNLEFYDTGSHLAEGEGPWKAQLNNQVASAQAGPGNFVLSEFNVGNIREFVTEASLGGDMLWNLNSYVSGGATVDNALQNFSRRYFGNSQASQVASLYTNYYNAYWQQRTPDFSGTFPRQYLFQDLRYARSGNDLLNLLGSGTYNANPFDSHGPHYYFIQLPDPQGATTELGAALNGTTAAVNALNPVVSSCTALAPNLPAQRQAFFNANMCLQAQFMLQVNIFLQALVNAELALPSNNNSQIVSYLKTAENALKTAQTSLNNRDSAQSATFSGWYSNESDFGISNLLNTLSNVIKTYGGTP